MRERRVYNQNHRSNRTRRTIQRNRCFIIATVALMLCIVTCVFVTNSSAQEEHKNYKYYTSIQIQDGDSLWAIAREYGSAAHINSREYIAEVKQINHLQGDEIHSGQYLTIPYYATQIK